MERLRAAIWYADIRGFTTLSDTAPGPEVIDLLNELFEALAAPLRERGGQVLKFIGDAMLATFAFEEETQAETCGRALDAALEATAALAALNRSRAEAGAQPVAVDFALHVGEVLYGNVGAADRLDFTAIGPAINEVVRIEALCQPLGRPILVSAEFAAMVGKTGRPLESVGQHALRGVKAPKELFAVELGQAG
jgi:adenylate cyclase